MRRVKGGNSPTEPHELWLRGAADVDLPYVEELLEACGLPRGDVPPLIDSFAVAALGGRPVGVAALEPLGDVGLLRSVAVEPTYRDRGVARALCEHLIDRARAQGLRTLYLLTTDAADYFRRYGFAIAERDSAPEAIKTSTQFSEMCPSTAILMLLSL